MTSQPADRILEALKSRLKRAKVTYPEIARALKISLPTVKRWMCGKTPISVQNISRIAEAADISLWEILDQAKPDQAPASRFTLSQENFLVKQPHFYAFFEEHFRKGKSLNQIQKEHGISARSCIRYLKELEKFGIAHRTAQGEWRTHIQGTLMWDDHGPMGKFYSSRQITGLSQRAIHGQLAQGGLWLNGWKFTETSLAEFCRDLEDLRQKYRIRSLETTKARTESAEAYSFLAVIDRWEDEITRKLVEL